MVNVEIPVPTFRRGRCEITRFAIFKLFPVLLTITIMWGICLILTLTGVFEEGNLARTDVRLSVLSDAPWFRIPYPGQFGWPTVTGVLACTVESISYYPTVAQMCSKHDLLFYLSLKY